MRLSHMILRITVVFAALLGFAVPAVTFSAPEARAATGAVTVFAADSAPFRITSGPDGNLWFTAPSQLEIGRITTSGVVTLFGADGTQPDSITSGPDGNLWFTAPSQLSVGRITTGGAVTVFGVGVQARGITSGPDGNLWFAAPQELTVGRITTGGAVTLFGVGVQAAAITSGPDGNLWFTASQELSVGRITTGGAVTLFGVGIQPGAITSGSERSLWFTASQALLVGQLTTAGSVTTFGTGGTQPVSLTFGPDGNLWVTATGESEIVRISTPPPEPKQPTDRLLSGQGLLRGGATLTSADGRFGLTLQGSDGNLVVYFLPGGVPMWSSSVLNDAWLINQGDGNVVLYNSNGQALWSSGTAGNGPSTLIMQTDGNLVLYRNSDGKPTWATGSFCEPTTQTDRLQSGQCLARGGVQLHSADGRFTLKLQDNDGNLVLYQGTTPLFATGTIPNGFWLQNQTDGNLVLYNTSVVTSPSQALFSTQTQGNGASTLILEDNGNLVLVRNSDGSIIWASNTCCH